MNKKQKREAERAKKNGASVPAPKAQVKEVKEAKPKVAGALPDLPKMPKANRAKKARPKQPCACGCQTPTTGTWAPGHDARAKGWALRISRGLLKIGDVPANEQQGAKLMLKALKEAPAAGAKIEGKAKGGINLVKKQAATETISEPEPEPAPATEPVTEPATDQKQSA